MERNYIIMDIPLLTRILEQCREGVKSDAELHFLLEKLIEEQLVIGTDQVLTMDNYKSIMDYQQRFALIGPEEEDD